MFPKSRASRGSEDTTDNLRELLFGMAPVAIGARGVNEGTERQEPASLLLKRRSQLLVVTGNELAATDFSAQPHSHCAIKTLPSLL